MDQAGYSPQYIDHQLAAIPALEHIHHSLAEPSKVNYAVLAGCLAQAGQLAWIEIPPSPLYAGFFMALIHIMIPEKQNRRTWSLIIHAIVIDLKIFKKTFVYILWYTYLHMEMYQMARSITMDRPYF